MIPGAYAKQALPLDEQDIPRRLEEEYTVAMNSPNTPAPILPATLNRKTETGAGMPDKVDSVQYPKPDEPRVSFNVLAVAVILGIFLAMVALVYSFAPSQ